MTEKEIGSLYSIIGLSILFLIFSLMLFFYIRSRFLNNVYNTKKWVKPIYEILFGGAFGIFSLFFFYYIQQFNADTENSLLNFLLFSIVCFPLLFYCSSYASVSFTIVSIIIWSSYLNLFVQKSMYMILFSIISFQVIGFCLDFFKNKFIKTSAPFLSILFLLIITVSVPSYRSQTMIYIVLANLLPFSYLYIIVAKYLNDFFNQTIEIKEKIRYENKYFINSNYSKSNFYDFIKEEKISFGYFIMIDFKYDNPSYIDQVYNLIVQTFKNEKIIFFKTQQKNFCFFIKTDVITKNDAWLENNLKKIHYELENSNKKVNFLISIYGINSNFYEELIIQCRSLVSLDIDSKTIFFNQKNNNLNLLEKQKVKNLYSQINFNSINIEFNPLNINNQVIVVSKIKYPLEMNETNLKKKFNDEFNLIQRIISNIIIYQFNYSSWKDKANLLVPYPTDVLSSEEFKIEKFINTFCNNFGKDMFSKVIITLPANPDLSSKVLVKNLNQLRLAKIKIGIYGEYKKDNIGFDYYF